MTTPRDLLKGALELLGVIDPIEDLDADEASGLFARLNRMIGSWSTQGALIYADTLVSHVLTVGDGVYTIGTGANISTTRPIKIKTAYISDGTHDYPVEIIDEYAYSSIGQKSLQSRPSKLYYNPEYPTGTIKLWPVPSQADTLYIQVFSPLSQFTGLSQEISLPEGYEEAIEYNLAKRFASIYNKPAPMEVLEIAKTSLANIKRANRKNDDFEAVLDVPFSSYGRYDIYGDFNR